jgi:hypothetical protein
MGDTEGMEQITRRHFTSGAAACLAALGAMPGLAPSADAQILWKASDWHMSSFDALLQKKTRARLIYNITQVEDGGSLQSIRATLNGLRYGFGVPAEQITIVAALHGPANLLNYDDSIWRKYEIGVRLNINDPKTGKPAVRNPYYPSKFTQEAAVSAESSDPNDEASPLQDASVEGLQRRGVHFLSCHAGLEMTVRQMAKDFHLSEDPEAIVREMVAHTVPHVLVVASISAAMTLLQSEGGYGILNA